ncbi:4-hydroxybenzoate octaprenyltransferase [Legionella sainthelensi]|uniref:UbiA family prenyltransferase n=1 Tax=Legionella sainthelensi TaxID=28087 RepID=UPI000F70BA65|nr:UbiA family prenyltransferase [Legionella sainthelensi]VEB38825.1 4-hydroxybenzoate octaprenyltransferase [Legionella sainthelensi]
MSLLPLIVDLDGTLIHTDILHESALGLLRSNPFALLRIPYWLAKGKAALKQYLAKHTQLHLSSLPYNNDLLQWLKQQKTEGRKLILCTASDRSIANAVSEHLGIFDEVIASDGAVNLAGKEKAKALVARYGQAGFDYVGNSKVDIHVWQCARKAVVVNASTKLAEKAEKSCEVEQVFPSLKSNFGTWCRVLRVHQWLKNVLLFIPLLAAHQIAAIDHWIVLIIAFCAFSLCASSVYIINDLMDLESDRLHPRKCKRPFASGQIPAWMGVILAPLLLFSSFLLARGVEGTFIFWLGFYFLLTCLYSWKLKRIVLVDCLVLSVLYTLRIIAGAAAGNVPLSFWLLTFSIFLFLSLALVKRYSELQVQLQYGSKNAHGRGYYTADSPLIQVQGIASGFAAVLVLTLYIHSDVIMRLYKIPELLWAEVPILLFWINWMWLQAHRGKMHDDPLVFAVKDRVSLVAGIAFSIVLILGALGLW